MNEIIPESTFNNPMKYYRWLRSKQGYSPRAALSSVLMRFCADSQDYHRRLESIAKVREERASRLLLKTIFGD